MRELYSNHTFDRSVPSSIPSMTHPYTFAVTDRFLTQTMTGVNGEELVGKDMIYMDVYMAGSDFLYPAYKGRELSAIQKADVFAHPLYKQACNFYGDIWRFYNDTKRLPLHPYEALMTQMLEGKLSHGIGDKMAGLATNALTSAIVNGLEMGKTVRDKVLEQKEKDGILSAAEAQELSMSKHYRSLVDRASSGGVLSDAENEFMYTYKTQEEIRLTTAKIMMEAENSDIDTSASGGGSAVGGDGDKPKRRHRVLDEDFEITESGVAYYTADHAAGESKSDGQSLDEQHLSSVASFDQWLERRAAEITQSEVFESQDEEIRLAEQVYEHFARQTEAAQTVYPKDFSSVTLEDFVENETSKLLISGAWARMSEGDRQDARNSFVREYDQKVTNSLTNRALETVAQGALSALQFVLKGVEDAFHMPELVEYYKLRFAGFSKERASAGAKAFQEFVDTGLLLTPIAGRLYKGTHAGVVSTRQALLLYAKEVEKLSGAVLSKAEQMVVIEAMEAQYLAKLQQFGANSSMTQAALNARNGFIGEARAHALLEFSGYDSFACRLPGNKGIDHVFVKFGAGGVVEDIVIVESKFAAKGGAPKLARDTNKIQQLSGAWLEKQIKVLDDKKIHAETWNLLTQNMDKIRFKGNVLDQNGINRWYEYVVGASDSKTAIKIIKGGK